MQFIFKSQFKQIVLSATIQQEYKKTVNRK